MVSLMKDLESPDEAYLAQRAITDSDAFVNLYRQHLTRIFRYHMAHTGDRMDAEDLTSQTFLAALEGIRSFRGTGSFTAWLFGIASRKRLMFYRIRGRRKEIPLETADRSPDPGQSAEVEVYRNLDIQSLTRALRRIAPDRAETIILSFFGGLSNREIGELLRKSEAAVKMLISRGLQDLKERTSLRLETDA